jgi:murein endopeptidase
LTRLGLDFGIIGKYVNGKFIGANSFEVEPGKEYEAMLVLRAARFGADDQDVDG